MLCLEPPTCIWNCCLFTNLISFFPSLSFCPFPCHLFLYFLIPFVPIIKGKNQGTLSTQRFTEFDIADLLQANHVKLQGRESTTSASRIASYPKPFLQNIIYILYNCNLRTFKHIFPKFKLLTWFYFYNGIRRILDLSC